MLLCTCVCCLFQPGRSSKLLFVLTVAVLVIALACVTVVIGGIVISMYLPMFDLITKIG